MFAKKIAKMNQGYTIMTEEKRFYTMLLIVGIPLVVLDFMSLVSGHKGLDFIALIWLLSLIAIRLWWIEGNLKKYLDEK
jgi:hypothetical protein